jgi:simple sugar transport system ATP-binding protein
VIVADDVRVHFRRGYCRKPLHALDGLSLNVREGDFFALVGQNGAGKSTLIKILTGAEHPDKGFIELEGKPVQVRSPQHSQELGISTVYQEINLCTNISVAENIMLGREPRRFGSINWKKMNDLARQAIKRLGIAVDVTQPLGNYSIAIQQMVAIARSLEILKQSEQEDRNGRRWYSAIGQSDVSE